LPVSYQWYYTNNAVLTTAGGVAQTIFGIVYAVTVTNGGNGYTVPPSVSFIGGGGQGAGASATISGGAVTAVTVTNINSGYTNPPQVVISPPDGALAGQTTDTLELDGITTNNAGGYYVIVYNNDFGSVTSSVAVLTIAYGPTITQQPANQFATAGGRAAFNVGVAGTAPLSYQWWMSAAQQTQATAGPFVLFGEVVHVTMTNEGAGYLTTPNVQFVGGSGSGAGGTAVVSNGMVTAINITNLGSGYNLASPTIQIDPPISISLTGQTNSLFSLTGVGATNAGSYFVVVTNNYGSVTSSAANLYLVSTGFGYITGPVLRGTNAVLSFVGLQGTNYVLYRTFNLLPANWVSQATNLAGPNGALLFTNAPVRSTNNFWQIRLQGY
jgi:hypothetical protein